MTKKAAFLVGYPALRLLRSLALGYHMSPLRGLVGRQKRE
jgi:hypothetical protein